jgi:hypothetical protein
MMFQNLARHFHTELEIYTKFIMSCFGSTEALRHPEGIGSGSGDLTL